MATVRGNPVASQNFYKTVRWRRLRFRWIFETAGEIPHRTAGVIKRNEKAVSMSNYILSQRHLSKGLFFFVAAKMTFRARLEKNSV
jgi:hypothetical protein